MTPNIALIKERLEHGAQKRIAAAIGVKEPTVSNVITGNYRPRTERGRKTLHRVQVAVARAARLRLDEAFPASTRAA
jgi:DNA-binding transcriptional regulator YdaS (Cro superfamily)